MINSSIRRADCDDFHLSDSVIHPPNDGMGAKDNNLPVAAVSSTGCKVTIP
jgi:hypothetical protein